MTGRSSDPDTIWIEDADDDPQWSTSSEDLRDPRAYRRVPVRSRRDPPAGSVWLSPACCTGNRLWCEEDPGPCDECGTPWVPYAPEGTDTNEIWRGRT